MPAKKPTVGGVKKAAAEGQEGAKMAVPASAPKISPASAKSSTSASGRGSGSIIHRYICQEGAHNKFWQLEQHGDTTTIVTFGRIGSDGKPSVATHPSQEAADKFVAKMIAEKTKKGYVRDTPTTSAKTSPTAATASTDSVASTAAELPPPTPAKENPAAGQGRIQGQGGQASESSSSATLTGVNEEGNSWTYIGPVLDGLPHGRGVCTYVKTNPAVRPPVPALHLLARDSDEWRVKVGEVIGTYTGEFKNGQRSGMGNYIGRSRCFIYNGGFLNNVRHGEGEVRLDGWVYDDEDNATNYYYFDKGNWENGCATFERDTDKGAEDGSVEDVREDRL